MDTRIAKIAELLREAGETHHVVYRITDGADDDWASWYADWLIELSELGDVLGVKPVRSQLVYVLVLAEKEYAEAGADERWQDFYARRIVDHFAGG